ncbi:hypothetical protein DFR50_15718 [Roseiarcus fermentans]|uniref:Uncharacterized protein n=1 Tax=Roseiarcus fermentans TaxID=1473586 RepID=A0A366EGY4_9HYPH|nr:hypothetical protein DFR50_15718 [Roseiarcus fermentans]
MFTPPAPNTRSLRKAGMPDGRLRRKNPKPREPRRNDLGAQALGECNGPGARP